MSEVPSSFVLPVCIIAAAEAERVQKVGTVVPGVRIPVLHEDILFREQPDYAMLLSWNMAGFIIPKYREMGYKGKFILPVPELEIVE